MRISGSARARTPFARPDPDPPPLLLLRHGPVEDADGRRTDGRTGRRSHFLHVVVVLYYIREGGRERHSLKSDSVNIALQFVPSFVRRPRGRYYVSEDRMRLRLRRIISLSWFATWSSMLQSDDGQADPLVRATSPTKGELHNARPSVRRPSGSATPAQKFQSIPLAAVSQIYLNRHRVIHRFKVLKTPFQKISDAKHPSSTFWKASEFSCQLILFTHGLARRTATTTMTATARQRIFFG